MSGCLYSKKSASPKKENYLSKHEQMQFLILLQEDDYKANIFHCFQSNRDTLFRNKNKFPGKLTVYNYDNIDDSEFRQKYIIEGNILPKVLYVKLLKENIFIPFETYPMRYLNSKMGELRDLFIALRAKTIKISKSQEKKNDTKIDAKINANVSHVEVGIGGGLENIQKLTNNTSSELHFLDTGKPIRMDELHDCKSFYYLPKEYEWVDIIERRINNNLVSDKYTYEHTEFKILKTSIMSKLQLLDIAVNYNDEEYTNIRIHYEIEYYPLQMDDTSAKLQLIKEPTHNFHLKNIVQRIQSSLQPDKLLHRQNTPVIIDVPTIQTSMDSTFTICSSYMDSVTQTSSSSLVIEVESPMSKTPRKEEDPITPVDPIAPVEEPIDPIVSIKEIPVEPIAPIDAVTPIEEPVTPIEEPVVPIEEIPIDPVTPIEETVEPIAPIEEIPVEPVVPIEEPIEETPIVLIEETLVVPVVPIEEEEEEEVPSPILLEETPFTDPIIPQVQEIIETMLETISGTPEL